MTANTVTSKYRRVSLSAIAKTGRSHSAALLVWLPISLSVETQTRIESSFTNKPLLSAAVVP